MVGTARIIILSGSFTLSGLCPSSPNSTLIKLPKHWITKTGNETKQPLSQEPLMAQVSIWRPWQITSRARCRESTSFASNFTLPQLKTRELEPLWEIFFLYLL